MARESEFTETGESLEDEAWALGVARGMLIDFWAMDYPAYADKKAAIGERCPSFFTGVRAEKVPRRPIDAVPFHVGLLESLSEIKRAVGAWPAGRRGREQLLILIELIDWERRAFPWSRFKAFRQRIEAYGREHAIFTELRVLEIYALQRAGLNRQGLALVEAALAQQPEQAALHHLKALLLMGAGRRQAAGAQIDTALQRFPNYPRLHVARARLLMRQRRFDQALTAMLRARELNAMLPDVVLGLPELLLLQVPWFRRAQGWKYALPAWLRGSLEILLLPIDSPLRMLCLRQLARQGDWPDLIDGSGRKAFQDYSAAEIIRRSLGATLIFYLPLALMLALIWLGIKALLRL